MVPFQGVTRIHCHILQCYTSTGISYQSHRISCFFYRPSLNQMLLSVYLSNKAMRSWSDTWEGTIHLYICRKLSLGRSIVF